MLSIASRNDSLASSSRELLEKLTPLPRKCLDHHSLDYAMSRCSLWFAFHRSNEAMSGRYQRYMLCETVSYFLRWPFLMNEDELGIKNWELESAA